MIIWSESLDRIVPTCNDFEDRLIKLLWRSRPSAAPSSTLASHSTTTPSVRSATPSVEVSTSTPERPLHRAPSPIAPQGNTPKEKSPSPLHTHTTVKRNWYGKKITVVTSEKADLEAMNQDQIIQDRDKRPIQLYAPVYNGLAAGLSLGA
jgi:hypothetical protein